MQPVPRGLLASPHCGSCPCARNGAPFRPVAACGLGGGLCIVGEGPGQEELLQGYPFIGPSGKVLNKGLQLAGADRVKTFIANALLCKRPVSDEEFPQAVDCCRARLQADLQAAQPTAICALGGTAMRALQLPVTSVSEARGTVQYSPLLPGVPVIGTIHPAALLRGGAGEMAKGGKQKMNVDAQAMFLFADIAKTARVAAGSIPAQWSDDIAVVHEPAEVLPAMDAILKDVYEWGILGLDLEWVCVDSTNPLDALGAGAHRARITWVGVGCGTRAVSFKWEALWGDYERSAATIAWSPSGLEALQAAMADENLPKLCHNKQADKAVWEAQVGPIRGRHLDCYLDDETEFLTRAGWKFYRAIAKKDWLATIDTFGRLEWQHYTARIRQRSKGPFLQFETRHTRAVVTPGHNMWCRPMRRTAKSWRGTMLEPWQMIKAKALLTANTDTFEVRRACALDDRVPKAAPHPFQEWADAGKPWLELIGIWLTDGSLSVQKGVAYTIQLHQAVHGRAVPLLNQLEKAFGLTWGMYNHREGWRSHPSLEKIWRLGGKCWAELFRQVFGWHSKERHLADFVWNLSRAERIRLLEAMFLGDGHTLKKTFIYNTFSRRLADDVQALCLSVGWPATMNASGGGFHVQVRRGDSPICQIRARIRQDWKRVHNNGNVVERPGGGTKVCFSVPNGRLITRSKGRPAFYGNSMLMHHAAFPGIDHDLQQVASQFLCIPPWKVEHARAVAAAKERERERVKAEKVIEREQKKVVRMSEHEARNRKLKEDALAKKALKKAEHETRNAKLKADKEARKAAKGVTVVDARQLMLDLERKGVCK